MTHRFPPQVAAAESHREVGIQTALILALVDGEELRVLNATEREVEIESPDPLPAEFSLTLSVFDLAQWTYTEFRFDKSKVISRKSLEFSELCRVALGRETTPSDRPYVTHIAQLKSLWRTGPHRDGSVVCGQVSLPRYDSMEVGRSFKEFEEQRRAWFGVKISADANRAFSQLAARVERAFSVRTTSAYDMLLELGIETTVDQTLEDIGLVSHGLFARPFNRLYIGNEFCPHLFPSTEKLLAMLDVGRKDGLDLTVVCPYLMEHTVDDMKQQLAALEAWSNDNECQVELVINDWGCLELARTIASSLTPTLGKLLNKHKKDPRVKWYWGHMKHEVDLQQNNLNAGWYREYLARLGLERFEFEAGPMRPRIPNMGHSLHYPFYYTNSSVFCMLHAEVTEFYAGKQKLVKKCPRYCADFCYMYPDHLNLIGKGNTIFGLDNRILVDPGSLQDYIDEGVDRLVFMPDC